MIPASFADAAGRTWSIRLDDPALDLIDAELGEVLGVPARDLLTCGGGRWGNWFYQFLAGDPDQAAALFWVLCRQDAADRGIGPAAWLEMFEDVRVRRAAVEALYAAAVGDLPDPCDIYEFRVGAALAWAKLWAAQDTLARNAAEEAAEREAAGLATA